MQDGDPSTAPDHDHDQIQCFIQPAVALSTARHCGRLGQWTVSVVHKAIPSVSETELYMSEDLLKRARLGPLLFRPRRCQFHVVVLS